MPAHRYRIWKVRCLLRNTDSVTLARRAGDRLLHLASGMENRGHLALRLISDGRGAIEMFVECCGVPDHEVTDWVFQDVAGLERSRRRPSRAWPRVTEVVPRARLGLTDPLAGLASPPNPAEGRQWVVWPTPFATTGTDLLMAMRQAQVEVRLHLAPVNEIAAHLALYEARDAVQAADPVANAIYRGTPVAARLLIGHRQGLSPRLRAALLNRGLGLALQPLDAADASTAAAWAGEETSLLSAGLPFGAAQCLTVIPVADASATVCGIPLTTPVARPVPIDGEACTSGLRIGAAVSSSGQERDVRVREEDLLLHTQVIGSTGSGKSTLLAALARECRAAGIGITVLDPHGQLVDRILQETPAGASSNVVLVRSAEEDRPIPLNPLAGPNPELMADTLVQVLRELHDPRQQGFMGPVWERWFALLLAAQQRLIGKRANLALIPAMASDRQTLGVLGERLEGLDRSLAREFRTLFRRREEDFGEHVVWVVSKFQRLVGSPIMRGILGSGRDAIDVVGVLDSRATLLIDLASNTLGNLSAQLLGEMWLAKHWEALSLRKRRTEPHLLIVDEAHLFASGLLPRILTQARKYGVGVVLAHQNLEQLEGSLREAVISSTNNVVVFRTGIQEAGAALVRLGSWPGEPLTRLERMTAAASLNVGSGFTEPFTLRVDHNCRATPVDGIADEVQRRCGDRYGLADPKGEILTCESLVGSRDALNRSASSSSWQDLVARRDS